MRCIIDPKKAILCGFASFVFLFLSILSLQYEKLVLGLVYLVLSIVYLYFTFRSAVLLEMDDRGLRDRFLWFTFNELPWINVREVGIANLKVLKNAEKKKLGELYIYFSDEQMGDEERLRMCLHWPPKDKRYMRFSQKRIKAIQKYWEKKPVFAWIDEEAFLDKYYKY